MGVNNVTGPNLAALAMASLAIALCLTLGAGQEAAARNSPEPPHQQIVPLGVVPFGDVDCSTTVNAVDALKVLRHTIALSVTQSEPCDNIGAGSPVNGDVDCDGDVDPVDALKVFRYSAALSVSQTQPCPGIGT